MVYIKSTNSFKNILWLQWLAATGAMVILLSLSLMVGWTSPYLAKLTAPDSPLPITLEEASWVASLLNFGRLLGAIVGGISVHCFGSKQTLIFIGFPALIAWTCLIVANSVIWLYIARITAGISLGMSFASFPLYLGEVSSPTIRGAAVSLAMSGMAVGILIGSILGANTSITTFAYIALVPTLTFILLFLWMPQSPHHLIRLGRMEDAKKSIARYNPSVDSTIEMESLKHFIVASETVTLRDRLQEFNIPRNRKAGLIVLLLFFFMQFSGLNTVIFYMEIILTNAKLTFISPATGVMIVSTIGVVSGAIAVYTADKFRRKVLMIISSAGVCVSMVALGINFFLLENNFDPNVLEWLPLTSIIVFQFLVGNGITVVPNMILSELFAPNIKSLAACFASISIGLFSFSASKCYQPLVNAVGEAWTFWLHAILSALCVIFSALFLPETKGKSLQEIQDALGKK